MDAIFQPIKKSDTYQIKLYKKCPHWRYMHSSECCPIFILKIYLLLLLINLVLLLIRLVILLIQQFNDIIKWISNIDQWSKDI